MRADAPGRRGGRQVGALPAWIDDDDRSRALAELDRDACAASSHAPYASRIRTLHRALDAWHLEPFPPTLRKVRAFAATLKRGDYRSASSYLHAYVTEAERRGYLWCGVLKRAVKDGIRSCERGMGPTTQARPLPLDLLGQLPLADGPWVRGARPEHEMRSLPVLGGYSGRWNCPPSALPTWTSRATGSAPKPG